MNGDAREAPAPQAASAPPFVPDPRLRTPVAASLLRPDWPAAPGVHALTTLRGPHGHSQDAYARFNMGVHAGDDPRRVLDNRRDLAAGARLPSSPHWLRQVHGVRVHEVRCVRPFVRDADDAAPDADAPAADAVITRVPGAVLVILTADCLPVLFAARDGSAVGAAHAGWRGLAAGVLEATLREFAVPPAGIVTWIGPGIGAACYEVDARVREAFLAYDADADAAFAATRPGHWRCDLVLLARLRLRRAGVADVYGGGFDTFGDARFYSYRRDGAHSGRMATLIWMEP